MEVIVYFGTPVPPSEGQFRKVMFFIKKSDSPDLIYNSTRLASYSKEQFFKKFVDDGNVIYVEIPIPLKAKQSLYVSSNGTLFLAHESDHSVGRKEIGRYDKTVKQFFQELEGNGEKE